ncbi:hypothetical protein ACP70R_013697 [Stipagrostis hirtigluma subsp. patula]
MVLRWQKRGDELVSQGSYSDSDDGDEFQWDSDGEVAGSLDGAGSSAAASRNLDAPGPSMVDGSANGAGPSVSLMKHFEGMGFTSEMVLKAMKENGDVGEESSLLDHLLNYKVIDNDPVQDNCSASGCVHLAVDDNDRIVEDEAHWRSNRGLVSDYSNEEDFLQEMLEKDKKVEYLVRMGFPEDEAKMAITRCGNDASICILIDSIYASETSGDGYFGNFSDHEDNSYVGIKKKRKRFRGAEQGSIGSSDGSQDVEMPRLNRMVGFKLHAQVNGPPYFYYENVAVAPKGVWATISRFLYDIPPEFVDSNFLCAATRKRGYVHNLPIENRSPLNPLPPKTIFEAFPHYKKWWPSWDPRKQLNCLRTSVAWSKLIEQIHYALANTEDPPPPVVQSYVLKQCRTWNLVWVGLNKVAPLEPDEMEFLLGFPKDHTRGVSKTERYKSLGNSFQVDTVAYHLSVLRDMYPHGMNVLSLFSGIGGAEVALHRLGIHMKTVVSVEISEVNRFILKSWWEQTQTGTLIEITDVQDLTLEKLESYIARFGGFDLVIGGSPCNNLAGSNRYNRDGLEGEHSSLFHHYVRILDSVKSIMKKI